MYNNELKTINSLEKAYLLGLFYSDGNVSKNQVHSRIELNEKDKELLIKIKEVFPFFKLFKSVNNKYTLYSGIKKVREHLIKNGVLPAKSFENKDNLKLPKFKNKSLYGAFICGYFDGDGGCHLELSKGKDQKRVYIYSNNLNLMNEIKSFLSKLNIICFLKISKPAKGTHSTLYVITISTQSYQDFYNLIYISPIFMKRKHILFDKILKTPLLIPKEKINCKISKDHYVVANGYSLYKGIKKQRWLCRDCKKHFCP